MRGTTPHSPEMAHLFQCRSDPALFAVSLDEAAGNIPPSTIWYGGWELRRAFALAADTAFEGVDGQLIANAVHRAGYYVWRDGLR